MSKTNASFSAKTDDYGTPEHILARVRVAFSGQGISLDPASSFWHNERVQALRFYDRSHDGLEQSWFGYVFCNPPYGRQQAQWASKALDEFNCRNIRQCVLLLGSALHTQWFLPFWTYPICVVRPRINFIGGTSSNSHDNILVGLGIGAVSFSQAFKELGTIIIPSKWYQVTI